MTVGRLIDTLGALVAKGEVSVDEDVGVLQETGYVSVDRVMHSKHVGVLFFDGVCGGRLRDPESWTRMWDEMSEIEWGEDGSLGKRNYKKGGKLCAL